MSNFLTEHLIHRDDDFMVIHKPAGLLTVPGKTEDLQDCLINRLVKLEPKTLLIHRLDRDTSGILAFGLSKWGQKTISRQFQERQTDKTYQAVVAGTLEGEGTIDVITFTSSSTATNFAAMLGDQDVSRLLSRTVIACIGPITRKTVE